MNKHNLNDWKKFSNYLWYSNDLNIWIDISKIKFNSDDFQNINQKFVNVFKALEELENGAISNIDENRQVGHYWLRNSSIAPNNILKNKIDNEISSIKEFGKDILEGNILNSLDQKYTDVYG